jgi:hypothetical protein
MNLICDNIIYKVVLAKHAVIDPEPIAYADVVFYAHRSMQGLALQEDAPSEFTLLVPFRHVQAPVPMHHEPFRCIVLALRSPTLHLVHQAPTYLGPSLAIIVVFVDSFVILTDLIIFLLLHHLL